MNILIKVILILNLYSSIRFLIGILIEKKLYKKACVEIVEIKSNNYILMPVYREEDVITETINYFLSIMPINTKLVLITTDKELNINKQNPTLNVVQQNLTTDKVMLINYPFKVGNKGNQLNYALENLKYTIQNDDYVVLYDADSRPDKETFKIVEKMKYKDKKVIQQNTIFLSSKKNFIGTIESICETRWSIGFEKFNQRINENNKLRSVLVPYTYCVGHGLFIRRDLLNKVGNFPLPNEDVPLGLTLNLLGYTVYTIDTYDYGKVKENLKPLFMQQGNWIKAAFISFSVLKNRILDTSISSYRKILFFFRSCLDVISWFQYCLLLLITILNIKFLPIYVMIYMIDLCSLYVLSFFQGKCNYPSKYILGYPIREVIRGLSFMSYIYQKNKGWYYDE